MILTGDLNLTLRTHEDIASGLGSGSMDLAEAVVLSFLSGAGAGLCNLGWSKSSTLAAGASETWTLSALTDDLGRPVAFARVKLLLASSGATVSGDNIAMGSAASHEWTAIFEGATGQTCTVKPLGALLRAAFGATAYPVSSGSSDQLKVANTGANPITYRIVLLGCST